MRGSRFVQTLARFLRGKAGMTSRLGGMRVNCWGANDVGQLGLGDTQQRGDAPGEMGAALPVVQLK